MFDEHQDMQSPEEHGAQVQEIDYDDSGSLGVQELPLARARAARCRIDARGMPEHQQLSILRQVAAEHQDG
jgi:hypothetical protein